MPLILCLALLIVLCVQAVCCSDLAHCCPSGFRCNLTTQKCDKKNQPWINVPMVKKDAKEEPSIPVVPVSSLQELESSDVPDKTKSSVVFCDNFNVCPDGTTCCRHPRGVWFCCPYSPVSTLLCNNTYGCNKKLDACTDCYMICVS